MNTDSRTLVLIDPSSPDGEGGLDVLEADDHAVTLLLMLHGQGASSLEEFASAEGIDIATAGSIYLDQVAERLDHDDVESLSTSGYDTVGEILHVVRQGTVRRVVLPASLPGLSGHSLAKLAEGSPVPIVIAPRVAA
jgi:hypothetical protein